MKHILILITALLVFACSTPEQLDHQDYIGGNIWVVTDAGDQWVVLDGRIEKSTAEYFLEAVSRNPAVDMLIIRESAGGYILEAQRMGLLVHEAGLDTGLVGRCLSACVDLYIAGHARYAAVGSTIGIHSSTNPAVSRDHDQAYYEMFGLGHVNVVAYNVPNEQMLNLSSHEAQRAGIVTDIAH